MAFHQARNVAAAAGLFVASFFSITLAEEANPAVHVEADIVNSCYSARTGFGSLWMSSGDELHRVDFHDNSVRRVPVKGLQAWHSSVTVGEDAVWLGDARATIYKVDPQTEQVIKEIRVDLDQSLTAFWNLAAGEGSGRGRPSATGSWDDTPRRAALRKRRSPFHPIANGSLWHLVLSGFRERQTTNCTALIQPPIRWRRLLNYGHDQELLWRGRERSGYSTKVTAMSNGSTVKRVRKSRLLRPALLDLPIWLSAEALSGSARPAGISYRLTRVAIRSEASSSPHPVTIWPLITAAPRFGCAVRQHIESRLLVASRAMARLGRNLLIRTKTIDWGALRSPGESGDPPVG